MSTGQFPVSQLELKRDGIVDLLRNLPEFNVLTRWNEDNSVHDSDIIPKQKGDLASALQESLNRTGLSITVAIIGADEEGSQSIRAYFGAVYILISITEMVTQNQDTDNGGTGLGALFVAERCVAGLKEASIEDDEFVLVPRLKGCIEDITTAALIQQGFYCVNVHFTTKARCQVRTEYTIDQSDRIIVDQDGNPITS